MTAVLPIDENYDTDDEVAKNILNINDKIVYTFNKNKVIIKMTAGELVRNATNWTYNRDINEEKVNELEQYILDTSKNETSYPIWLFSVVYDVYATNKLILIDGQHRKEAIRRKLAEGKFDENIIIHCIMYTIDKTESDNIHTILDLFYKINNNRPLNKDEYPNIRILKLIDEIKKNKTLVPNKKAIKNGKDAKTAREPSMHEKELYNILFVNYDKWHNISNENMINNLSIISRKICWTTYENIYIHSNNIKIKYDKAVDLNFWLNLKSSVKYNPNEWIKFIENPELLS